MNRVASRAAITVLLALLLVAGLGFFVAGDLENRGGVVTTPLKYSE